VDYILNCTPYEANLILQAAQDRQKQEQDERITLAYIQAYWTALWMAGKKPPSLDSILGREEQPDGMTDEQMFSVVKALHKAATGG
jgi:hypothetical protein